MLSCVRRTNATSAIVVQVVPWVAAAQVGLENVDAVVVAPQSTAACVLAFVQFTLVNICGRIETNPDPRTSENEYLVFVI